MSGNRRVLVLQHSTNEHLGHIAEAFAHASVDHVYLRPDLGHDLPTKPTGYDGLVVMGGPQSAYDEATHGFLAKEKDLVSSAVIGGLPVLGVCLGCQILADVLGGTVHQADRFEVGWKEVVRADEVANDQVLGALPRVFTPLHWHGDIFDLPSGGLRLGSSIDTPVQGFAWRGRAYGLLFHLEMTLPQVMGMASEFEGEVIRGGATAEALLAESPSRVEDARTIALDVFGRWTALL